MRIVVIRAGALGDMILARSALRALRLRFPEASIALAGYPHLRPVVDDLVDDILPVDHPRYAPLLTGIPSAEVADQLAGTDLLIAWTQKGPGTVAAATTVHASPYPPPGTHAADWLVSSLTGITGAVPPLSGHIPALVREASPPRAFLHPGAGAVWKRWRPDRFAELGRRLLHDGYEVYLIEGPADMEAVAAVQRYADGTLPSLRQPSLKDLILELRRGSLFVGNDSGVTHLAAALGLSTVALFGPTDPASWAPRGKVVVVRRCQAAATGQGEIRVCLEEECMAGIEVDEVRQAIAALDVENPVDNRLDFCREGAGIEHARDA
jgi:heptosyltransferase-3